MKWPDRAVSDNPKTRTEVYDLKLLLNSSLYVAFRALKWGNKIVATLVHMFGTFFSNLCGLVAIILYEYFYWVISMILWSHCQEYSISINLFKEFIEKWGFVEITEYVRRFLKADLMAWNSKNPFVLLDGKSFGPAF